MVQLRGNYIFVRPGDKAFLAASNWVNYVELGDPLGTGFFLIGEIIDSQFRVSARLFDSGGKQLAELRDNNLQPGSKAAVKYFPEGGYEVQGESGELLLRLRLQGPVCLIQGRFYSEDGELAAEGGEEDFRIFRAPAILGKSGGSRGIVIGLPVSSARL